MFKVKLKYILLTLLLKWTITSLAEEPNDVYDGFWSEPVTAESIRSATFETTKLIMDDSIDPCDDFYEYACGKWDTLNPIPAGANSIRTFEALQNRIDYYLKKILLEPDKSFSSEENDVQNLIKYSEAELKLMDFMKSCMDTDKIQQNSQESTIKFLERLHGWNFTELEELGDQFDCLNLTAYLSKYRGDYVLQSPVSFGIEDPDKYMLFISSGSIQFEDKARYNFSTTAEKDHFYYMYNYLIKSVFKRVGINITNLENTVREIIDFEIELVNLYPGRISKYSGNNMEITLENLTHIAPGVDWHRYVALVIGKPFDITKKVTIVSEEQMSQLASFLSRTNPKTIGMYLFFMISAHIDDMWITNLYRKERNRIEERKEDRFTNCLLSSHNYMEQPFSALFVRHFFDDNTKREIEEIFEAVKSEFYDFINRTSWIDEAHKEFAFQKLDTMKRMVGYNMIDILLEDSINEEYSSIQIKADKFLDNVLALIELDSKKQYQRVGQYLNRSQFTEPFLADAFYGGGTMTIPMAIINPPFYHKYAPNWYKYGGIGFITGHEIIHGFDSSHVLFDNDNNLHDIKSLKIIGKYYARSVCMSQQYSKYKYNETNRYIDGSQTLDENISDNVGMMLTLDAYRKWLNRNPDLIEDEKIPGLDLSVEQLFFLGNAQIFCESYTPKSILNAIKLDVHAPFKFRVIGTVSNSDSFSTAFNCPFAAPMNPVRKCKYD